MTLRITLAAMMLGAISSVLLANPEIAAIKTGDDVVIGLKGEPAQMFARRTLPVLPPAGVEVEFVGIVTHVGTNDRVRIEHSVHVKPKGKPEQLVTLTIEVAKHQIAKRTTPAGTRVFSSPESSSSAITTEDSDMLTLQISDLTGVKLRTWTLVDEIGN